MTYADTFYLLIDKLDKDRERDRIFSLLFL
mgnify:CR=1 FL=1